jgi:hypothetical protein
MLQRRGRIVGVGEAVDAKILEVGLPWVAEAAFLVAAADEIFEEDMLTLAAILAAAFDDTIPEHRWMDHLEACANALENDGWEDRIDALSANLPPICRPLALRAAAVALISDHDFSPSRLPDPFLRVAEAIELPEQEARRAVPAALTLFEGPRLA